MKRIIIAGLAMFIAGCAQQEMQDLQDYVVAVKARAPTPIDPIPQIKQAETFLYVADGRRDPFTPSAQSDLVTESATKGGPRPDPNRRKEELEAFPLDTMDMVGTLERKDDYWGLVKTQDGTIHRVKPGNYLGQNYGKIVEINEDHIALRELIQDGSGGYLERQASLTLGERE